MQFFSPSLDAFALHSSGVVLGQVVCKTGHTHCIPMLPLYCSRLGQWGTVAPQRRAIVLLSRPLVVTHPSLDNLPLSQAALGAEYEGL